MDYMYYDSETDSEEEMMRVGRGEIETISNAATASSKPVKKREDPNQKQVDMSPYHREVPTVAMGPILMSGFARLEREDGTVPDLSTLRLDDAPRSRNDVYLKQGQHAALETEFATLKAVQAYPHQYIGKKNGPKVVSAFFNNGKILDRPWDLFYLHRPTQGTGAPLILVRTGQFKAFLNEINYDLGINLSIPFSAFSRFAVAFDNENGPRPRYLGRSHDREAVVWFKNNIPQPAYYARGDRRTIEEVELKIQSLLQGGGGNSGGGISAKEKKAANRNAKFEAWGQSLNRVQQHLGLRSRDFNRVSPNALFSPEDDAVFISVDVEAWERNKNIITEVGIAWLDTRDLRGTSPGEGARNWRSEIVAHHLRITEHTGYVNKDFVQGCADSFLFDESEFIPLSDISKAIAYYFRSASGSSSPGVYRPLILVGHSTHTDIAYLRQLGYDANNLLNLHDTVDTEHLWQYLHREPNPRSLGAILSELDIEGWNLHNAGNDAVYTLQAMLGIAVRGLVG